MNLSSKELSTLTLIASDVPAEKVSGDLGPDALLVKEFLLDPKRAPAPNNETEIKAQVTAQQMREWFVNQKAASRKRASTLGADQDWDRLMAL